MNDLNDFLKKWPDDAIELVIQWTRLTFHFNRHLRLAIVAFSKYMRVITHHIISMANQWTIAWTSKRAKNWSYWINEESSQWHCLMYEIICTRHKQGRKKNKTHGILSDNFFNLRIVSNRHAEMSIDYPLRR